MLILEDITGNLIIKKFQIYNSFMIAWQDMEIFIGRDWDERN